MSWQILLAISVVTYSISVLLQKILLKNDKSDPIAYSIVFQLLTGIIIGIYAIFNGFSTPNLLPLIPNLIIMIILYGAGNVFIFSALKIVDASEFTIIFTLRSLCTIIGAIIFLNEGFSIIQLIGTILIISSIVLISWKKQKFSFSKGFIFSILAALSFGFGFTNDAFIINNFDVPSYLTIAFIIPSLGVWAVYPKSTVKMKPLFEKRTLYKLLSLTVIYAISAITIFLAYQVGKNSAQIAPLNQTSTIFTVILSIIFLKERSDLWKKLFAVVISFIGVILII